jgi:hypothetical protein
MERSRAWLFLGVPALAAVLAWAEFPRRFPVSVSAPQRLVYAILTGIIFGTLYFLLHRFVFPFIARLATRKSA